MRKHALLALAISCTLMASAQKKKKGDDIPAFGVVDKTELEMKACDFDEKAEAMVLLDDGFLDFDMTSGMSLKRRVRIKILNDKGLEWANVHLQYRSEKNEQDISGLEAQTYNLDEAGNVVITKVEKSLVYEKKINKKYTEKVFTFPAVKVGSVVEYKFKHKGIGLIDWYFQRSIPVKYSRFKTDFPPEIELAVVPVCSRNYERQEDRRSNSVVQTFVMTNEPAFRSEPYIINEDFYRDRLETKVSAFAFNGKRDSRSLDWIRVIRFLMEDDDFGLQIKKNIPRTAELDAMLKTITHPYLRMKTVYKYVQDNMTWNEYLGIWASDGVKSAWKDKKGTVGEINLILVNLLKDADLKAFPVLVSTHDYGIVNTADAGTFDYPGYMQFNKVMAYVEIDGKTYVLDASQKETPVHLYPPDILYTEGLLISKIDTYEWGWRTLWNQDLVSKNMIQLNGAINENGKLDMQATVYSYDYARLQRLSLAKKGKDKFTEKYLSGENITVDDVSFENLDSDSLPLIQKVKFSQALNSSGDYRHFSINLLSGLENNPFVADDRLSDVFFGSNQTYIINANVMLPDGYELEAPPKNMKMIMPDTSITISRASQVSNNMLLTRIQLDFKRPVFQAGEYPDLQEFYKQLYAILNEQYVIKKKS